jgi:hypothetical protein
MGNRVKRRCTDHSGIPDPLLTGKTAALRIVILTELSSDFAGIHSREPPGRPGSTLMEVEEFVSGIAGDREIQCTLG